MNAVAVDSLVVDVLFAVRRGVYISCTAAIVFPTMLSEVIKFASRLLMNA